MDARKLLLDDAGSQARQQLFSEALGWSFEGMPTPDGRIYWLAQLDDKPVGGLFPLSSPQYDGMPEMSYIAVDDGDAPGEESAGARREIDGADLRYSWSWPLPC